ncbi:unnamed protein product [Rotaria sp. Silwood2]|nr:unnamed protein product [Rotaria sp. Silwood2]
MKINKKDSYIKLNDLPDEILLNIFKKLNNVDLLYSFYGVNERLNKILHDRIFTSRLNFLKWSSNLLINRFSSDIILNRFCLQILPEISMKIEWLDLESSSMKYILYAADYPNLNGLNLYNIEDKTAKCFFTDQRLSSGIFKNQIIRLIIGINPNENDLETVENICTDIFTVFTNLTHLIFCDANYNNIVRLLFDFPCPRFSSSSLLLLNIKVQNFSQCLYILDGRFNQLHTLYIDLANIHPPDEEIENKRKIANLKCFFLSCALKTSRYDQLILSLLCRMSNLERLGLYLTISVNERFIDGNHLKENILNHMLLLNQFIFDIRSLMFINNQINLPSNEEIQGTFTDFHYTKIISCVDYFVERKEGQCHIYSYPYSMVYYHDITNNFPGGLFKCVREVSLYDEHPFEHDFFLRISQSFPFLDQLSLINRHAQNYKQSSKSMNDNKNLSVVKYSYLKSLRIRQVHDDYIEEFLFHTKTYFENILLDVDYKALERVTENFTRDDTRINSAKINEIYLFGDVKYPRFLHHYFPFAKIH